MSLVKTAADRPYSVSLAMRIASSSPSTRTTADHRPERLLVVDAHRRRHLVEHGRLHDRSVARAAGERPSRPCRPASLISSATRRTASTLTQAPSTTWPRGSPAGRPLARAANLLDERVGDRRCRGRSSRSTCRSGPDWRRRRTPRRSPPRRCRRRRGRSAAPCRRVRAAPASGSAPRSRR